ncbi:putative long-chain fatty-acid--CoA ligase domain protein [Mycobacterium ulcerans str. Harvey]|uniref:Long-chain fatty-acid--CoA ligase domain protein n=1 Tax=Mycobacterium ulcerans str. Harvey TaxID=1299332 RepID=A0ABN0QUK5_MYCUL|nr:putative long-chain fatty-acid--CoA ligase domain protein [Mycobacterium ulcerans str. Harvey]
MHPTLAHERPDIAKIDNRPPSVARMFLDRVAASPSAEAFRYPHGDDWESVTWEQVGERVGRLAAGLISLGIARRIGSRWHRRPDTNGCSSISP